MLPIIKEQGAPIVFFGVESLDEVIDKNVCEAKKLLAEMMISSSSHFEKNLYVDAIYFKKEREFINDFKSNPDMFYGRRDPTTIALELLKLRFLARDEYFRMYS
ncbi:MAG: hypothetical protein U9R08_06555 [Nanoarchaeota archaeon]|nr:hypothetical protein [Nanoarchaeota archaeon]